MTHYNHIYYEVLEEVREITIVEEEDETYLDIDDPTEIINDLAEENPDYEEITEVAPEITTKEYRIEEPDDFSISMVCHQTISPDLPEDYQHQIVSSVSHQQHQLEEDFSVTQ